MSFQSEAGYLHLMQTAYPRREILCLPSPQPKLSQAAFHTSSRDRCMSQKLFNGWRGSRRGRRRDFWWPPAHDFPSPPAKMWLPETQQARQLFWVGPALQRVVFKFLCQRKMVKGCVTVHKHPLPLSGKLSSPAPLTTVLVTCLPLANGWDELKKKRFTLTLVKEW